MQAAATLCRPACGAGLRSTQFVELGLQVDDLLLQLFVLGLQGIWNPQVVAAVTANRSLIQDFLGAERTPHDRDRPASWPP